MPTLREKILEISTLSGTHSVRDHINSANQSDKVQEASVYVTKQVQRSATSLVPTYNIRSGSKADVELALNSLAKTANLPSIVLRSTAKADIEMAMNQLSKQITNRIRAGNIGL